jgi:predicted GIY-YIG superfamily endonuclease
MTNTKDNRMNRSARKKRKRRSTKGALIKGVSRMLPLEVLDSTIFAEHLQQLMKKYAGVYVLYRKKKVHYVGLTRDILGRLKNHLKDKHMGKWDHFTVFRIQRIRYLKDLETLLQYVTAPAGNIQEGKVPKDADFNRVLMDVLKDQKKAIRGLEKALT